MIDSAQLHRLMTQVPTNVPDDIQRIIVNRDDLLKLAKLIQREALLDAATRIDNDPMGMGVLCRLDAAKALRRIAEEIWE